MRISDWSSDVCSSDLETSRTGNLYGMAGMALAIVTTLSLPQVASYWLIVPAIVLGGAVGTVVARRIRMTALPQLVAAFHSLVGLAAVLVAAASFLDPAASGIGEPGPVGVGTLYRTSVVSGKGGSVRVEPVGSRNINKNTNQ